MTLQATTAPLIALFDDQPMFSVYLRYPWEYWEWLNTYYEVTPFRGPIGLPVAVIICRVHTCDSQPTVISKSKSVVPVKPNGKFKFNIGYQF